MNEIFPSCPTRFTSPLCTAAASGKGVDVVTATVLSDPNEFEGDWCPLFVAAFHGNLEALVSLLSQGADVQLLRRSDGFSAAHAAAQGNQSRVISLLAAKGGRGLLEKKARGDTPLHIAARLGHHEVMHALINLGCNPNLRNDSLGASALWLAVERQLMPTVQLLVRLGASVHVRSAAGITPLQLAQERNYTALQTLLIELGADKPQGALASSGVPASVSGVASPAAAIATPSHAATASALSLRSRVSAGAALRDSVRGSLTGLPSASAPKPLAPPAGSQSRDSSALASTGISSTYSSNPPSPAPNSREAVVLPGSPVLNSISKASPALAAMNITQLRTERERLEMQLKEVEHSRSNDYIRMKEAVMVELNALRALEPRLHDASLVGIRQRQAQLIIAQTYVGPSVLAAFDSRMNALERQMTRQNEEREKLLDSLARVHQEKRGLATELSHLRAEFLRSYQEKEALLKEIVELKGTLTQRARTQSQVV